MLTRIKGGHAIDPANGKDGVAGFITTLLPKASAGAAFQAGMAIGKFHGVITP